MNILYHTTFKVCPTIGGIERTTVTMASELKDRYACRCISVYEQAGDTPQEPCFGKEYHWIYRRGRENNIRFVHDIIVRENIDMVIVQGGFERVRDYREAIGDLRCRLVFAHHFRPGWELTFGTFRETINRRPKTVLDVCRWGRDLVFYPIRRKRYVDSLPGLYKSAYDNADAVVLLSKHYMELYREFGAFADVRKFRTIHNALSFSEYGSPAELSDKSRTVLIVSRLDEPPKKISTALRIWKSVKSHPGLEDWKLTIVGSGPDLKMYQDIVRSENIGDVCFAGRRNPVPYYKDASIFMMTSKSESWPLTLSEAQQFGAVPIAFDAFEALREIITDQVDGMVISDGDVAGYEKCLLELMRNDSLRKRLAINALKSCRRFDPEKIAREWIGLEESIRCDI